MVSEPPEPLEPLESFHPVPDDLAAMLSADVPGGWAAHALVQARVLWPMHVVSLRTLEPQATQWMAALRAAGIHELPRPGCFTGGDLRAVWSRPMECLALTQDATAASVLLDLLRPGATALGCAVDRTPGVIAIEFCGPGIERLLARLVDASAIPMAPGQATRARMVDVGVHLLRIEDEQLWLLCDRPHVDYLAAWLLDASQRIEDRSQPSSQARSAGMDGVPC
jgi:heterotetrameric sarcosine oxidase gamma subunit